MRPFLVIAASLGLWLLPPPGSENAIAADFLGAEADAPPPPPQHLHPVFPRQYVHQLGRNYYLAPRWIPRQRTIEQFDGAAEEIARHDRNHFDQYWFRRPRGHGFWRHRH